LASRFNFNAPPKPLDATASKVLSFFLGAKRRSNPAFVLIKLDCFAPLAMTVASALRQETDHGVGEGVRLLDI
jgi:hypothetical protein